MKEAAAQVLSEHHVSLSRTVGIRYHQIESLLSELREQLAKTQRCMRSLFASPYTYLSAALDADCSLCGKELQLGTPMPRCEANFDE